MTLNHCYKLLWRRESDCSGWPTLCKVLKYLKFCCSDVSPGWNVPKVVVDYWLGSLSILFYFMEYLQNEWKTGYLGIISYMNAVGHLLGFRRTFSLSACENVSIFLASEIFCKASSVSFPKRWSCNGMKFSATTIWIVLIVRWHLKIYKTLFHSMKKGTNKLS